MWRGAISFGMVAIPVRLYLATESKSVSFRLLCPADHTPVRNKRWCPEEDREIGWSEAVRGYEVGKDEYVVVTDQDLDDLPLTTTHTIDIVEFCPDSEIEAGVYLKSAYSLEPEAVGVKPYALLRQALEKTGTVAIGKIALRDREHLCRLALHDQGLLLITLHWPDEIRSAGELAIHVGLGKTNLAIACLEKASEERCSRLVFVKVDPRFDSLRADGHFQALIRRMGLDNVRGDPSDLLLEHQAGLNSPAAGKTRDEL